MPVLTTLAFKVVFFFFHFTYKYHYITFNNLKCIFSTNENLDIYKQILLVNKFIYISIMIADQFRLDISHSKLILLQISYFCHYFSSRFWMEYKTRTKYFYTKMMFMNQNLENVLPQTSSRWKLVILSHFF